MLTAGSWEWGLEVWGRKETVGGLEFSAKGEAGEFLYNWPHWFPLPQAG